MKIGSNQYRIWGKNIFSIDPNGSKTHTKNHSRSKCEGISHLAGVAWWDPWHWRRTSASELPTHLSVLRPGYSAPQPLLVYEWVQPAESGLPLSAVLPLSTIYFPKYEIKIKQKPPIFIHDLYASIIPQFKAWKIQGL